MYVHYPRASAVTRSAEHLLVDLRPRMVFFVTGRVVPVQMLRPTDDVFTAIVRTRADTTSDREWSCSARPAVRHPLFQTSAPNEVEVVS